MEHKKTFLFMAFATIWLIITGGLLWVSDVGDMFTNYLINDFLTYEMEPEDCFEGESYNPDTKVCYIQCDTPEDCEAKEDEIYGDVGDIFNEIFGEDTGTYSGAEEWDEESVVITYKVDDRELEDPTHGNDADKYPDLLDNELHYEIWSYITTIFPPKFIDERVGEFVIFSDGVDGTMAYVMPISADGEKWVVGIDPQDAQSKDGKLGGPDFIQTIVHEYTHILTLNPSQLEFGQEDCNTYHTGEGCAYEKAYIHAFFDDFWAPIWDEYLEIDAIVDDEEYYEALDDFYYKYKDRFVSDYAVTNPGEDIAESFAAFILRDKPTGNTIADEKIHFFYRYDELVVLRGYIRKQIAGI